MEEIVKDAMRGEIKLRGSIEYAIAFAKEKHKTQYRANGKPYIIHCLEVYKIMRNYISFFGDNTNTILIASLLHDTIEDTDTTEVELREKFGDKVTDLVLEVTKDENGNFSRLKTPEAKLIKESDRLQSLTDCDKWLEKNYYPYAGDTRILLVEHFFDEPKEN